MMVCKDLASNSFAGHVDNTSTCEDAVSGIGFAVHVNGLAVHVNSFTDQAKGTLLL